MQKPQSDLTRWSDASNLLASWEPRSYAISALIPPGSRVFDFGCGAMTIEKHLPQSCRYIPCDIVKRDDRTIVCDLNQEALPKEAADADIILFLGVLEYIHDLPGLVQKLAVHAGKIIFTYCDPETSGIVESENRLKLGWVNAFSGPELLRMFTDAGFNIVSSARVDRQQRVYVVSAAADTRKLKKVGVLSYSNIGNFGDRLGMHLLSSIMPSNALVERVFFKPWINPSAEYDLVVLGIGNSMFAPLLTEQVMSFVRASRRSVGIFGTQYRQDYDALKMKELVGALDFWFARYQDDMELYGTSAGNCFHLGDWLIREFMMTTPTIADRNLKIGPEILKNLPLDRTIQQIQSYRRVYSERLHPLLCALTSAEEVAFKDQRESGSGIVAGKFQSMLKDIFGREFPEQKYWLVDKEAVVRYRDRVGRNVEHLKAVLHDLLGN